MLQSSPFIGCRLCEGRDMHIVMHHGCSPVAPSRHKHAWSTEIWAVFNGYYEMRVPGRKFWFGFWSKLAGQVRVWTLLRYFNPEAGPSQLPTHPHNREAGSNFDVTLMMHSQVWQHPDGGPGLGAYSSWGPCSLHSIWSGKKRLLVTDMKMLYKVCLLGCYHGRR